MEGANDEIPWGDSVWMPQERTDEYIFRCASPQDRDFWASIIRFINAI